MKAATATIPSLLRALAFAAPLTCGAAAHAVDLTVEVQNTRSTQGHVNAAIYNTEGGWLKDGQSVQAQRVQAAEKTVLVFANLPAGRYAVSLFHDENGNQKMDTNVVGMPTERYGISRDAMGRMGPPAYADAAFDLQADTRITINLR